MRHTPRVWSVLAVMAALALNVLVLWRGVDLITPPRSAEQGTPPPAPSSSPPTASGLPVEEPPVQPPVDVVLTVTPRSSSELTMMEEVRADPPLRVLLLRRPAPRAGSAAPRVVGLTARADGRAAEVTTTSEGRWSVALQRPAAYVELNYVLSGATEARRAARDRRALLWVGPLTSPATGAASVVVEIVGATVHNLVCPERPLAHQLCGRLEDDRWRTAPLPADEATVIAQVDLPTRDPPT